MESDSLPAAEKKPSNLRRLRPTPGRLLFVLLLVEIVLMLSERFQWFAFNEKKGWTVLIAIASVLATIGLLLLWWLLALCFHWRFQFSIRSLLVLTLIVAIPCSWLAVEMKWAREQRTVVDAVVKLKGCVVYDYQLARQSDGRVTYGYGPDVKHASLPVPHWLQRLLGDDFFANAAQVILCNTQVTDADLETLKRLPQLHCLWLHDTKISDAGLEHLRGLKQLYILWLARTQTTDAGLERLQGLTQLHYLILGDTQVTDAGLRYLTGMTRLQSLSLENTKVTDAGLENLEGLSQLQWLCLGNTRITGAGLKHLSGLTKLGSLLLDHTQVTSAGLAHLKGLPQLECLWLDKTQVSDAGLRHLSGLTTLQILQLYDTRVTDAGLEHLRGLTRLYRLTLTNTKVTGKGVKRLQQALPKCFIMR